MVEEVGNELVTIIDNACNAGLELDRQLSA